MLSQNSSYIKVNKWRFSIQRKYGESNFTHFGGNRINWTYGAIWCIELQAILKHCILQTIFIVYIYHVLLHLIDLVWGGILCCIIKGSVFLVPFV